MAAQAFLYVLVRLGSVFATFLIFSLIGRVLPDLEASKAYFIAFVVGFCLATSRMCCQIGSSINVLDRASERIKCAKRGYLVSVYSMLPLGVVGSFLVYKNTSNLPISMFAFVVIFLGGLNLDVLRGALNRSSMFPLLFGVGSLVALICIQWIFPRSLLWVIMALFIQWLFVICSNLRLLFWVFRKRKNLKISFGFLFYVLSISSFDGLIVNAPFLGVLDPGSEVATEISIIVRIFISSLPLLPLLLHWTNSRIFNDFCKKNKLPLKVTFKFLVVLSGFFSGLAFLFLYSYISNKSASIGVVIGYLVLLVAYSFFITEVRFSVLALNGRIYRPIVLILIILTFFSLVFLLGNSGHLGVTTFIASQSCTLILAAILIKKVFK